MKLKDESEMILVPGGWFWMGARADDSEANDDEKPRHLHYVRPFYMGITCVTTRQFERFVSKAGYEAGGYWRMAATDSPVSSVCWYDAQAYVEWADL